MSLVTTIKSQDKLKLVHRELYESYYHTMMNVCNRYAKNSEQATEMLKRGFITFFNQINLPTEETIESRMKEIMIDSCVEILQKNKHEYTIVGTIKALDTFWAKEEEIIDEEIILVLKTEQVISAIQKLSPAYRVIVNMFLVDNYSFLQIANKLDIAESTAKMNYENAMYALRKLVKQLTVHNA